MTIFKDIDYMGITAFIQCIYLQGKHCTLTLTEQHKKQTN